MTHGRVRTLPLLLLVWLCGASLRVTMLAIAPLLPLLVDEFGLSAGQVGLLSVLPLAMFSLMALPGSALIGRVGPLRVILVGLLLVLCGSAWRSAADGIASLYASAAVMGVGIAIMQPAMPVAIGACMPGRQAFGTALYANGLIVWELLAVGLTAHWVLPWAGDSWRVAALAWSMPVAVAIALVMWMHLTRPWDMAPTEQERAAPSDEANAGWREPGIWMLGLLMAGISSAYFLSNAFMPLYLVQVGQTALVTPALVAFNGAQLLASITLLFCAQRFTRRAWPLQVCAALAILSAGTFVIAPSWTAVPSAFIAGWVCGGGMILALALPPLLVPPHRVRRWAAGMFAIGYGAAFFVGASSGRLHDRWPAPVLLMVPIAAMAALQWLAVWRLRQMKLLLK